MPPPDVRLGTARRRVVVIPLAWSLLGLGCTTLNDPAPPPDHEPARRATETRDLLDVAAPREFRGVWVATVFNLDFPSRTGLSAPAAREELDALVDTLAHRGLNTLIFQVRPEGDALYDSDLEPWSRYLTGRQGRDPGYDPLRELIDRAHARGLEVHAWFNPYRAAAKTGTFRDPSHISHWAKDHLTRWGATLWLDPGAAPVQDRAVAVIADVIERYDIDGVHLDDYFYPYPRGRTSFPDGKTYRAYRKAGGTLSRADWRRSNVDRLVERIWTLVRAERPDCRMGISPFGIYRPGHPPGIRGMDQVTALYADPLAWHREGWMDYLAPQLYWPTTKRAQAYDKLLDYWDAHVTADRPLVVGLDATKVGQRAWPLSELRKQVTLARAAENTAGQIWFRADPILRDKAGLGGLLSELYREPALPPAARHVPPPPPPTVTVTGAGVELTHDVEVRGFVVYEADPAPGTATSFAAYVQHPHVALEPGTYAFSAVVPGAVESRAVRVTLPGRVTEAERGEGE